MKKSGNQSFSSFLNLGFPARYIHIKNCSGNNAAEGKVGIGKKMFEDKDGSIKEFIEKGYADKITKLKVNLLSVNFMEGNGTERLFYESLNNVKTLAVLGFDIDIEPGQLKTATIKSSRTMPKTLENVQHFEFWPETYTSDIVRSTLSNSDSLFERSEWSVFLRALLKGMPRLTGITWDDEIKSGEVLDEVANVLKGFIKHQKKVAGEVLLKKFDFDAFTLPLSGELAESFLTYCEVLGVTGFKQELVYADVFQAFNPDKHDGNLISRVIESMIGLHPAVLTVELPFLKALYVKASSGSFYRMTRNTEEEWQDYHTEWPALEKLGVEVDRNVMEEVVWNEETFPAVPVTKLYGLLFKNGQVRKRKMVKVLQLEFREDVERITYLPRVLDVVKCCPMVTKLEIIGWPGRNSLKFSKFWSGMVYLEHVTIMGCLQLGDAAFIGKNEEKPAFLELKRNFSNFLEIFTWNQKMECNFIYCLLYCFLDLKSFSLSNLDRMGKVTDKLFSIVFSNLSVSKFSIYQVDNNVGLYKFYYWGN